MASNTEPRIYYAYHEALYDTPVETLEVSEIRSRFYGHPIYSTEPDISLSDIKERMRQVGAEMVVVCPIHSYISKKQVVEVNAAYELGIDIVVFSYIQSKLSSPAVRKIAYAITEPNDDLFYAVIRQLEKEL